MRADMDEVSAVTMAHVEDTNFAKLAIGLKVVIAGFLVGVLSQTMGLLSKKAHSRFADNMVIVSLVFCVVSIASWAMYLKSSFPDVQKLHVGGFFTMAAIVLLAFSTGVYLFERESTNEENFFTAGWLAIVAIALFGIVSSFVSHSKSMVETKQARSSKGSLFVIFQVLFSVVAPTIPFVIWVSDAVDNSKAEVPYIAIRVSAAAGYLSFVLFSVYFAQSKRKDYIAVVRFAILFDIASAALSGIAAGYLFQSADETLVSSSSVVWALMFMPLLKLIQWIASHAYQAKVSND